MSSALGRPLVDEITSHLVVAALLPALYWLHRRWPIGERYNLAIHVAAVVPFSILHTSGMAALRLLWFNAIVGVPLQLSADGRPAAVRVRQGSRHLSDAHHRRGGVEFLLQRKPSRPSRCRHRRRLPPSRPSRGRRSNASPCASAAAARSWSRWPTSTGSRRPATTRSFMSARETFEIRSSLAKLESELDAKRFVRVHKSHVVNIARVTEVTPWVGGDWRIRLRDGAEVNLSRRYRQRFEALVTVRS